MKIRIVLAAMLFAVVGVLAACGGDSASGYDRDAAVEDMVEGGLPRSQAECVVDRVDDAFGSNKLQNSETMTAEDQAKLAEITLACFTEG